MSDTAQAGMPWSEIAESAYRAFMSNMRGTHGDAVFIVDWYDLPTPVQFAWEAAVRQADRCRGVPLGGKAPPEDAWETWKPPA